MSDDLPPPDLTKTADVPLDGLFPFSKEAAGEVPAEIGEPTQSPLFQQETTSDRPETLFSEAKSLRLSSSEFVVDNPILENEPRPASGPLPQAEVPAEPLGALRALWEESHDRGVPFYRRQGPVAGIGLLALLIIGAISFPWTRATIESGVVILIDDSDESAAVGAGSANREEFDEGPATGNLVMGTKSTSAPGSAEAFQSTSSQIATTAGVTAGAPAPAAPRPRTPSSGDGNGPIGPSSSETTVLVAPVQLSCEDPNAVPPACTTTEAPVTTIPTSPVVTEGPTTTEDEPATATTVEQPTTTEPETTTTENPTTTKKPTTTTEPDDEDTTTTTEPDDEDTTTTTEPDDEDTTTTTEPDDEDTTTTTEPDDEDTTTTTEPDDTVPDTTEPPIDSGGTLPTAVNCTPTTNTGPTVEIPPRNVC